MKVVFQGKTKTGKEITVRYPRMSDLKKLLDYINTLSDEKTFISYQGEHETLESERKHLKKRLEDIENKKVVYLLAFYKDKLVGLVDIKMSDKARKHVGGLGITVAKKFRGEGIGKLLMNLIEKEAKKEIPQLKMITLSVFSINDVAKKLYKKTGFVKYGTLPKSLQRNNTFEDEILMYKTI